MRKVVDAFIERVVAGDGTCWHRVRLSLDTSRREATMIEPALLDALSGSVAVQPDGVPLAGGESAILEATTTEARG